MSIPATGRPGGKRGHSRMRRMSRKRPSCSVLSFRPPPRRSSLSLWGACSNPVLSPQAHGKRMGMQSFGECHAFTRFREVSGCFPGHFEMCQRTKECPYPQTPGKARAPFRRQDVVRAGDVVAESFGRVVPQERGSIGRETGEYFPRFFDGQLQMFGRYGIDQREPRSTRAHRWLAGRGAGERWLEVAQFPDPRRQWPRRLRSGLRLRRGRRVNQACARRGRAFSPAMKMPASVTASPAHCRGPGCCRPSATSSR